MTKGSFRSIELCNEEECKYAGVNPKKQNQSAFSENYMTHLKEHVFFVPTVEDIIEEIGPEFLTLQRKQEMHDGKEYIYFSAVSVVVEREGAQGHIIGAGNTPLDAMISLYCELKK